MTARRLIVSRDSGMMILARHTDSEVFFMSQYRDNSAIEWHQAPLSGRHNASAVCLAADGDLGVGLDAFVKGEPHE